MSLYETLLERLDGHPYSNYFTICCPFHSESNPSFFVYEDDGRFYCKSCRKSGTIEYLNKFIGSRLNTSLTRSQKSVVLPRFKQWQQDYGDMEGIARYAHQSLHQFPQFQSYFKKRKIDDFIDIGRFGYIMGWLLFPVLNQYGKVVDIVVRAGKSKNSGRYFLLSGDRNSSHNLYVPNWKRVNESETVYVCFGVIDAWAFEAIGLPCVTGITGKSISADTLKPLNKKFVIVPDEDEHEDAHRLANKLGWKAEVLRLKFPPNTKDPDSIRVQFGNEYLKNLLGA